MSFLKWMMSLSQELMMDVSYCRQLLQDILSSPHDETRRVAPIRDIRSPWVRKLLMIVGFLPDDSSSLILINDGMWERFGGKMKGGRDDRKYESFEWDKGKYKRGGGEILSGKEERWERGGKGKNSAYLSFLVLQLSISIFCKTLWVL